MAVGKAIRIRAGVIVTACAIASLGTASTALGAERWAAPGGGGTACTEAAPCDLETAVENVAVVDGDEVIVTPGTYTAVDLLISDAIELHGQDLQPVPTINVSGVNAVNVGDTATVRDLKIESSAGSGIVVAGFTPGTTVERVQVHASSGGGTACVVGGSATIRDSVCWQTGTNSRGVGANVNTFPGTYTIHLRNVTAIGVTNGIGFDFAGTGVNLEVDAANVIADGASSDVRATASLGSTAAVTLAHSNYATEQEIVSPSGISASVTNPGTGTNQTAAPLFVNAAAGDFHQQAGSPTIDAGALDGFTGALDYERGPRTLDGDGVCPTAPDIGADELDASVSIDCDPPETTVTGVPTGFTSDPTPTFDLQSDEPSSTFECKLDTGSFAPCNTPYTTPPLADGPHTLEVRATDPAANTDPTPASRSFTVDTDPPDTTIAGIPTGFTNDPTPTFELQSDEPSSTFECKLDTGSFASCSTPHTTSQLTDGEHILEVRATDQAANTEQTPASRSFTVDTDPPETMVSGGPTGPSSDRTPTFALSSDETGATFRCKVDGGGFTPCSTTYTTAALSDGTHTVAVQAVDAAGNADATAATRAVRIDTKAPETTITSAPKKRIKSKRKRVKVSLAFASNEPGSFQCSLDGEPFESCSSPQKRKAGKGRHTWAVRAIDRAGNAEATPAVATFKVKRKKARKRR